MATLGIEDRNVHDTRAVFGMEDCKIDDTTAI